MTRTEEPFRKVNQKIFLFGVTQGWDGSGGRPQSERVSRACIEEGENRHV